MNMNKKIKLYTTLFVVAFVIYVLTKVFGFSNTSYLTSEDEYMEVTEEPEGFVQRDTLPNGATTWRSATMSYEVYVQPKMTRNDKVLMSHANGQDWRMDIKKVSVVKPWDASEKDYATIAFIAIGAITGLFFLGWMLWIVFQTIRSIRRGEIFVADVSRKMETIGKLLVALYIIDVILGFLMTQYYIEHIHIANYAIVYHNDSDIMYIFTGLALMIISQVILMGKELKEEQDLTI